MVFSKELAKKTKLVNYDEFDPKRFEDIARKANIFSCIQCGTCSSSCESGRWTAMKTREIVRKAAFGDLTVLEDPDIWLCTTCYQCYIRCPRDVRPTDVIMELRNYAAKAGNLHPVHRAVVGYLKGTGHAVPINDQIRAQRIELGLDELPPTLFKYKNEEDSELKKYADNLFNLVPVDEKKAKKLTEVK
ncbi:hypothetical protein NEF87_002005 [Candidatus Lokiarchaeum ossiferum]|uniref:4Fe-4S ferredoxin-type domain-containing protein n=1 Tax=Candidatus Lokiarchaeum ossiferum TaxID=2951803 RepID=A0ABY6HQB7_9ARCH|nr:hypothetical protein NEF87_002005 [Candidatus Lokiarchaeum sp. B-35]